MSSLGFAEVIVVVVIVVFVVVVVVATVIEVVSNLNYSRTTLIIECLPVEMVFYQHFLTIARCYG